MKKILTSILLLFSIVILVAKADTVIPVPFLSRVSSGDTTPNYLFSKLVAGSNITLTKNNAGGNETITIASTGGSGTTTGTVSINGVSTSTFTFSTSTTGTDFNISTTTNTIIFNLPTASASNRGVLSPTDWTTFNNKAPTANPTFTGVVNFANASGTGVTATDLYTTGLTFTGITNSVLAVNSSGKVIATTTSGGTTYTGTYPIQVTGSVISTSFSTSTINSFSAKQTFTNASSTSFTADTLYSTTGIFGTKVTIPNASTTAQTLSGYFYDSTASAGTNGQYLQSTGTSTIWSTITGFVTNAYASSTFPSFSYASSTYVNYSYASTTFPNFTYASSTYVAVVGNQTVAGDKTFTGSTVLASTTAKNLAINGTGGAGYITLVAQSTNPTAPSAGTGMLHTTTSNGFTTLEYDNEATTNVDVLRDSVTLVKNTSGGTINKGEAVYITGSTGNVPNIAKAQANATTTLPSVFVAIDSIANNGFGQVMRSGIISNFDTSAFTTGLPIFLSTTTAGGLTQTRPSGTSVFVQRIGTVLVSGVGNGSIDVNVAPAIQNMESGTAQETWTGRNVVATGTLSVTGKTTLANASSTSLTVSGQSTLASTTVTGIVSVTGSIGISSSTPISSISVATGSIMVSEFLPASTSTTMTLNWNNSNTTLVRYGVATTTFTMSGVTAGQTFKLITCAPPSGTPGVINFSTSTYPIYWSGGTLPGNTRTVNKCDVWSFIATQATSSTSATPVVFGAQNSNF